jgi:hypothetical protein
MAGHEWAFEFSALRIEPALAAMRGTADANARSIA